VSGRLASKVVNGRRKSLKSKVVVSDSSKIVARKNSRDASLRSLHAPEMGIPASPKSRDELKMEIPAIQRWRVAPESAIPKSPRSRIAWHRVASPIKIRSIFCHRRPAGHECQAASPEARIPRAATLWKRVKPGNNPTSLRSDPEE